MRIGRGVPIALGIFLLICSSIASTALAAAPSVVGTTWKGTANMVQKSGYATAALTVNITGQKGTLFKGTITVKLATGAKTYPLDGVISGSKVYMTFYVSSTEDADSYVDGTLSGSSMTGIFRSVHSAVGDFTLTKQ